MPSPGSLTRQLRCVCSDPTRRPVKPPKIGRGCNPSRTRPRASGGILVDFNTGRDMRSFIDYVVCSSRLGDNGSPNILI